MEIKTLSEDKIAAFGAFLREEEHAPATVEKYLRDIGAFARWLAKRPVTKEMVMHWKAFLLQDQKSPSTINAALSALNGLFHFLSWEDCRAKFLKVQRRMFRDPKKELSRQSYDKLIAEARASGQERLALLMETICSTGVRVSELPFLTIKAIDSGRAEIFLKGKVRTILIPAKLSRKLLKYAKKQKITSGPLFITKSGKCISRQQIWAEMKKLCKRAGVSESKVFPHNLRHLFATAYYRIYKDIAKLADVLGHSSIETTRIYLLTSGTEHQKQLDRLGLVS